MQDMIVPQGIRCGGFPDDKPPVGTLTFEMVEGEITFAVDRNTLAALKGAVGLIEQFLDSVDKKQ